jgi:hypothetical protein
MPTNSWNVNPIKILHNGNKIMGEKEDLLCDASSSFALVFGGSKYSWIITTS